MWRRIGMAVLIVLGTANPSFAQPGDDLEALNRQVRQLAQAGRHGEAVTLAQRVLDLTQARVGPEHAELIRPLETLASLYRRQGRSAEAEPLLQRALAIARIAFAADQVEVALRLLVLAEVFGDLKRRTQARAHIDGALALFDAMPEPDPNVGRMLNDLGEAYRKRDRTELAEPLMQRALALREKALGPEHADVGVSLNNLGLIHLAKNRPAQAEPLFKRAQAIFEKAKGPEHPTVALLLNNLAGLYQAQGRYAEAEAHFLRAVGIWQKTRGPDHPSVADGYANLGGLFFDQRRYADAATYFERALAISEKAAGAEHPSLTALLDNLARAYREQKLLAEAEKVEKRALAIEEKARGPDHPRVAWRLEGLAALYIMERRWEEAERYHKRSLVLREQMLGPDHPMIATSLNALGYAYSEQGKLAESEAAYKRALEIFARARGPDHADLAFNLNVLGLLYLYTGRYHEAETMHTRALAIRERAKGPDSADVAASLNALATVHQKQGRFADAERLMKRVIALNEKVFGPEHEQFAESLNNLGPIYRAFGRLSEAAALYERAAAIKEKLYGPEDPKLANTLDNLALVYVDQGRLPEAETLMQRALAIYEKAPPARQLDLAVTLNNLAIVYGDQRRYTEAEQLMQRVIAIRERLLGPQHPETGIALDNLAGTYLDQGRLQEAEAAKTRALAILETALGPEHRDVAIANSNLAEVHFRRGAWEKSLAHARRAAKIIVDRSRKGLEGGEPTLPDNARRELARSNNMFRSVIRAAWRLPQGAGPQEKAAASEEAFKAAQWHGQTSAAAALAQLGARFAKGEGALAASIHEQQDLSAAWQSLDRLLIAARSEPSQRRNSGKEGRLQERLGDIERQLAAVNTRLKEAFPDYYAIVSPEPLSIPQVQGLLRPNEVLMAYLLHTGGETFGWAVTQHDSAWRRLPLDAAEIARKVQTLRCGLDEEEWVGATRAAKCGERLGLSELPEASEPLPFHLGIAHDLYAALVEPFEDMIKGKRLLLVPSGPLTTLPLHVLVTRKPDAGAVRPAKFEGYRDIAWLGRSHALTVLPAVASLRALHDAAKGGRAPDDYIGFGNPVLTGDGSSCRASKVPDKCPGLEVASKGPRRTAAPEALGRATISGEGGRRSAGLGEVFAKGGGAAAVLEQVRALCPLPDTAYEIKCVAERFKADRRAIRLDASAKETDLKALNAEGKLARYRIVHFATHGLLAGDVEAVARRHGEPALVMTPPDRPQDADDDGLLTASEVALLKLNAEWVVLSACNTAASDAPSAEALSGLARAFFYAGARALLVSHWPVYSDAAVRLTTRAFAELDRKPGATRAEALQRAMVELMNDPSQASNAHPAVWAPFALVGSVEARPSAAASPSAVAGPAARSAKKPRIAKKRPPNPDWQSEIWRQ
jgi:tetratricopeptide (TPR) repeat protein/CHAT domain-containing protein